MRQGIIAFRKFLSGHYLSSLTAKLVMTGEGYYRKTCSSGYISSRRGSEVKEMLRFHEQFLIGFKSGMHFYFALMGGAIFLNMTLPCIFGR